MADYINDRELDEKIKQMESQIIKDNNARIWNRNYLKFNWTNWTPTPSSTTPTTNIWWYYWNPRPATNPEWSTIRWWYVTYNPQNVWNYSATNWTYQPFSVADTLAQRAQWYQAQGLEWLANSFRTLNKENNIYNNTANRITDYYTALANDINSRENALAQRKESLANQLSQDIANQRQYVMDYFGPNWIFTNEINRYYDENGNYLASEAGRQMAMANAEWIQSGASLWAQRAARNEAYNNAFQNYLQVKEQELAAKMNISNQLISYMQALRQEYWDTQNTFVISQYQRANDLLNTISQSMAESQAAIQQAKLQQALGWSWNSSFYKKLAEVWQRLSDWTWTAEDILFAKANKLPISQPEGFDGNSTDPTKRAFNVSWDTYWDMSDDDIDALFEKWEKARKEKEEKGEKDDEK